MPQPRRVEPPIDRRPAGRRSRLGRKTRLAVVLVLALVVTAIGALSTNALGAGDRFEGLVARIDRFMAGPVPERSTRPTIAWTPSPVATATATPEPTPSPTPLAERTPAGTGGATPMPTPTPTATPTPAPTPTPLPPREPVDFDSVGNPDAVFAHQADKDWCAVAGTLMVLAIHGKAQPTDAMQHELASRVRRDWESWEDSHNGNWGPAAISLALEAYGVPGYEVRAYETRADALRDSARAIRTTGAPVVLLTWRGAHTWVMTGYRADADPAVFADAAVAGIYNLDPWYPWNSSIWGQSDPPGHFEDAAEVERNYLPWKRPEGAYPDRDGKFIAVVPTLPLTR